jgi:heme/copper-type cytochrome/quinol oxidase subunit 1
MRATFARLFGGSPLATLLKLLFVCFVIGAIMAGFGITPSSIPRRVYAVARSLADTGFEAVHDVGQYILTGAIIVVPIWLLMRLFGKAN